MSLYAINRPINHQFPATASLTNLLAQLPTDIAEHLPTLVLLVVEQRLKEIVELGVRDGQSTLALLEAASMVGGRVTSVDIEPCPEAHKRIRGGPLEKFWRFLQGSDVEEEILAGIPGSIDLVFIDTSHTYEHTKRELECYFPRVRNGGFLTFHDTLGSDVHEPIREFLQLYPHCRFYNYFNLYGFGVLRKIIREA